MNRTLHDVNYFWTKNKQYINQIQSLKLVTGLHLLNITLSSTCKNSFYLESGIKRSCMLRIFFFFRQREDYNLGSLQVKKKRPRDIDNCWMTSLLTCLIASGKCKFLWYKREQGRWKKVKCKDFSLYGSVSQ